MKHIHYGWVLVIIAIIILAIFTLTYITFGIFIVPLTTEFNWDRGALTGAFTMKTLVSAIIGVLAGRLSDKYGPRILVTISSLLLGIGFFLMSQVNSLWQVYLIWGLLMGIGGGFCYIPIASTIPKWFVKNKGLAMGLTSSGLGAGGLIAPLLAQWLISSYSWQQAFITFGVITLILMIPLAQFMKPSPERIGLSPYGEDSTIEDKRPLTSSTKGLSFNQAIRTTRFWIFGSTLFCIHFAIMAISVHIVPHAVDIGISAMVAASLLSIITVTSIIGRSLSGLISDRIGGRLTLTACFVTLTLIIMWLLFAQETWMLYLFAIIFGVAYGGVRPLEPVILTELFGLHSIGFILGCIMVIMQAGAALGPLLVGSIFDITGSYSLAFIICIVLAALAIILSLILLKAKRWCGGE